MFAAVPGFIYKTLFSALRKLYEEIQTAASAQGFLHPASATTPCTTSRKPDASPRQSTSSPSEASSDAVLLSAKCCGLDNPNSLGKEADIAHPTVTSRGSTSVAAGLYVLGGAFVLGFGNSYALAVSVVPVAVVLALAASWLVVWGLLEVTARRCASRLRRLVAGLHLQQKIAREAVRWVQELEVLFKAIPVAPSEPQPRCFFIAENASRGTKSDELSFTPSCKQAEHPARPSISWRGGSLKPFDQSNSSDSGSFHLQRHASSGRNLLVGSVCARLNQLLMWEEDVMCSIYEAIMRPTRGAQDSWQSLVSQGPWLYGQAHGSSNAEQNTSVRALKDASSRSWAVHSRLSAGLQVAVRRLLFFLNARQHRERERAMLKQRRSLRVRDSQAVSANGGLLARGPSRTLRQALLMQRQQHVRNGNTNSTLSLDDEVAQATLTGSGSSFCAGPPVSDAGGESHLKNASKSAPLAYERKNQRKSRECAYSHHQHDAAAPPLHDTGTVRSFRFPSFVLETFSACRAVIDGLAAAWWLQQQLSELTQVIVAAAEVAEIASNALRTTLEEEWTICPLPPPQPPRVWGLCAALQRHETSGDVDIESFRLLRCSVSPPPSLCQPFGSLSETVSPANRIALASMSRHIGASLALLRLPSVASFNDGSQKGALSCRHRCKFSVPDAEASNESRHELESRGDKGTTTKTRDLQLSTFLQLSVRHLRVACEEAERLQQSLRRPVQGNSVIRSQGPKGSIEEPSKKVPFQKDIPTQKVEALQQGSAEPLRCFEVYTAVGQECSSNSQKYRKEAALLADFADEDPAVRERSALIIQELEVRLQTQQVELQSMPLVLKEFSTVGPLASEDEDHSGAENEGIIRIVEGERHATVGHHASHGCKAEEIRGGYEAAFVHSTTSSDVSDVHKNGINHFIAQQISEAGDTVGPLLPQTDVDLVHETHNSLASCMSEEGSKDLEADKSLQLPQQMLCGRPSICTWKDSEASAAQSLISELQGLLTDQRASSSEEEKHNAASCRPQIRVER
ncbi:hypothetical protein Esti_005797 [Eimeria stiedai]